MILLLYIYETSLEGLDTTMAVYIVNVSEMVCALSLIILRTSAIH